MDTSMKETLRTNWHLNFVNNDKSERFELITLSGKENLSVLMHILHLGFQHKENVDMNWNISLFRNNVEYKISTLTDIDEERLLQTYNSFQPEREYYRPTITYYKNGKKVLNQFKEISMNLLDDSYKDELKMILEKAFNIDKNIIEVK